MIWGLPAPVVPRSAIPPLSPVGIGVCAVAKDVRIGLCAGVRTGETELITWPFSCTRVLSTVGPGNSVLVFVFFLEDLRVQWSCAGRFC